MKKTLFIASILALGTSYSATPIDGLYLGAFGGYNYLLDNLSVRNGGLLRNNASYNSGWNTGLRLGYQSNPMRYEFEYTYLQANLDRFNINGVRQLGIDGYLHANLLMANVYYDLPDMLPQVSPFLGLGIGYAFLDGRYNSDGPLFVTRYRAKNNEFAYQATTGLTFNFNENYAANISYRFVATTRGDQFGRILEAHLANAEVIYRFDEAHYK